MVTSVAVTPWAEWIEKRWRESGQSVTAFATRIGVSHVTFGNWIDRGFRPQRDTVVKVAAAIGADEHEALVAAGNRREAGADRSPRRPSDESPAILLYGGGKNLTQRQKDELARRVAETVETYWAELERTETE